MTKPSFFAWFEYRVKPEEPAPKTPADVFGEHTFADGDLYPRPNLCEKDQIWIKDSDSENLFFLTEADVEALAQYFGKTLTNKE